MKTLLITPFGLPIPASKGGAVANLIDTILEQNELDPKIEFTVMGIFDDAAYKMTTLYPHSKFILLKKPKCIKLIDEIVDRLNYFLKKEKKIREHKYIWKLFVLHRVRQEALSHDFDSIVIENSAYLLNVLRSKQILKKYKDRIFYHIHNNLPKNVYLKGLQNVNLLTISEYLERQVLAISGSNPDQKHYILHNGFDTHLFEREISMKDAGAIRKSIGIPINNKVVLFAGRIDPSKGIEQLCQAFSALKRDDVTLLVVGSHNFGSDESSEFEKHMKQIFSSMKNSVRFTGFVAHTEMWKYYKVADVAVLPSMWDEPAGLTIMEAMSSGLPVISTVSGGIPEFLNNDSGILLKRDSHLVSNLTQAMNDVLNELNVWATRGKQGQKNIRKVVDPKLYFEYFVNVLTN